MEGKKIKIKMKAYDHALLDRSVANIVATVKRTGTKVSDPIPLPTKIRRYTVIRAPHKYKDSREQFEMRIHKRLLYIYNPTQETIDELMKLDIPAGVDVEIKTY